MTQRSANVSRDTLETQINVVLNLDGSGNASFDTGIPFLEHMLEQIARHGAFDLEITAKGDLHIDGHHTTEDTGIALGMAFAEAIGDKKGIRRYGFSYLPMDEALTRCALDISGRPWLVWNVDFDRDKVGEMDTELFREFFQASRRMLVLLCTSKIFTARTTTILSKAASKRWRRP